MSLYQIKLKAIGEPTVRVEKLAPDAQSAINLAVRDLQAVLGLPKWAGVKVLDVQKISKAPS